MIEAPEHISDPKGMSFTSLQRFRDLTQLAQMTSTLMDHNRQRDWRTESEACQKLLTWTIIERNKIVTELVSHIFTRGDQIK